MIDYCIYPCCWLKVESRPLKIWNAEEALKYTSQKLKSPPVTSYLHGKHPDEDCRGHCRDGSSNLVYAENVNRKIQINQKKIMYKLYWWSCVCPGWLWGGKRARRALVWTRTLGRRWRQIMGWRSVFWDQQIHLTRTADGVCSIHIEYDRNGQFIWSVRHGGNGGNSSHRVIILNLSSFYFVWFFTGLINNP